MWKESNLCRKCYLQEHQQGTQNKQCPRCGKWFIVQAWQIKNGTGKFCSEGCARIGNTNAKKASKYVQCATCKKKFKKKYSELKKTKGDDHFCSRQCWYTYNQGIHNHAWRGGQEGRSSPEYRTWRKAVLQRDQGYCRVCHSQERIEVHHIIPFPQAILSRWDVNNGISLCHECHCKTYHHELEYSSFLQFIANVKLEVWCVDDEEE